MRRINPSDSIEQYKGWYGYYNGEVVHAYFAKESIYTNNPFNLKNAVYIGKVNTDDTVRLTWMIQHRDLNVPTETVTITFWRSRYEMAQHHYHEAINNRNVASATASEWQAKAALYAREAEKLGCMLFNLGT